MESTKPENTDGPEKLDPLMYAKLRDGLTRLFDNCVSRVTDYPNNETTPGHALAATKAAEALMRLEDRKPAGLKR